MKQKKMLLLTVLMLCMCLVAPTVGNAISGTITINGFYYGTNATISVYAPTAHSPKFFSSSETRYTIHLDSYVYEFKKAYSTTTNAFIALENISTGQIVTSPTYLNDYSKFTSYISGGDYYLYVDRNTSSSFPLNIKSIAPGTVNIIGPSPTGYLLKGNTYLINAYIEGSPTSVTAYVEHKNGTTNLGTLSNTSGNNYSLNYTFNSFFEPTGDGSVRPLLKVQANFASGTVTKSSTIYVTKESSSFYQNMDSTWYYNSPTINSFVGVANPNIMCYEYAVKADNTGEPYNFQEDVIAFMKRLQSSYHDFRDRPGIPYTVASTTPIANPDAIYYSNFHFAIVTAKDASGNPTEIISKWGPYELIKSSSVNPFSITYGTPTIYFKK